MLASLFAWMAVSALGGVMLAKGLRRLTDVDGTEIEERWGSNVPEVAVGGSLAILGTLGVLSFWGAGVGLGGGRVGTGTTSSFSYSAPNAPTVDAQFIDSSTVKVILSAFVGSGDATHDSTHIQIDRVGGNFSSPLVDSISGAVLIDTLQSNANLKFDTTYIVRARVKANPNKGGWSAYDSVTYVNTSQNVFFACQWPTTGSTSAAVQDCGTNDWSNTSYVNASSTFTVVASTGLDFPTTNVLSVSSANTASASLWMTKAQGYVDTMVVGDTISRRFYFRVAMPDGADPNYHATHDGVTGSNEDHNTSIEQNDGTGIWTLEVLHGPSGAGRVHIMLTGSRTLNKNTTYIYRDWVVRDASTTSILKIQLFTSSGSLLYDVSDFAANYGNGTNLSTGISATYGASNGADGYRQFQLGINGSSPGASGVAYYYGAFAVCSGLCNPTYVSGEGGTP